MINNHSKFTNLPTSGKMVAGSLPNDHNIEFFGDVCLVTKKQITYWKQRGNTHRWEDLPFPIYQECLNAFLKDIPAIKYLTATFPSCSENRWVELFIFHNYGDQDFTPDVIDGKLQPAENFRTSRDCPSLDWNSKNITTDDGTILTKREIQIIDLISDGDTDKLIASKICLSGSHFNAIKRGIFNKFNVNSKTELMVQAVRQNIV